MTHDPASNLVRSSIAARGYDLLNQVLWFPTGSDRLRLRFVELLGIGPGDTVLELGCGTGLVTRHLVATGATVTSVDGSAAMLAGARRRAPTATFRLADLVDAPLDETSPVDRVVLSFVLHELDPGTRVRVLRASVSNLAPSGRIGILDWGLPLSGAWAAVWRRTVQVIEPRIAHDILDQGLDDALAAAGLTTVLDRGDAGGRARVIVARQP